MCWGNDGDGDGASDIIEFFVCPSCQREFNSIEMLESHKPACQKEEEEMDVLEVQEEEEATNEDSFLGYFGLNPKDGIDDKTFGCKMSKISGRKTESFDMSKFSRLSIGTIAITSGLGKRIHKIENVDSTLEKFPAYDEYCRPVSVTQIGKLRDRESLYRYPVSYRRPKGQALGYVHKMKFTRQQREEWRRTIRAGLDHRARMLLAECQQKSLRIVLHRISEEAIHIWTTPKPVPVQLYKNCRVVLEDLIDLSLSGSEDGGSPRNIPDYGPVPVMLQRADSCALGSNLAHSHVPGTGTGLPTLFTCHMCGLKKIFKQNAKESITQHMSFVHCGGDDGFFVTHRETVGSVPMMVVEAFDRMSETGHISPSASSAPMLQSLTRQSHVMPHMNEMARLFPATSELSHSARYTQSLQHVVGLPKRDGLQIQMSDRCQEYPAWPCQTVLRSSGTPQSVMPRSSLSPRVGIAHPIQQSQIARQGGTAAPILREALVMPSTRSTGFSLNDGQQLFSNQSNSVPSKTVRVQIKPIVPTQKQQSSKYAISDDSDDDVQVITEVISID